MADRFGCAADLYRRGAHPRILLGPGDVDRLRQGVRRGQGRRIFNAVREKLAPIIDQLLAAEGPVALDALLDPGKSGYGGLSYAFELSVHEMAMAAVLADDARAMAALRRVLIEAKPERRRGFFGYHAYAFDMVHDRLTPEERLQYATEAVGHAHKLIEPFERKYYANAAGNGVLVHMFIAMHMALAVRGDVGVPDVEPLLVKLVSYLRATMHTAINPDGYPEEDVGYGTSVVNSLARTCHAVYRAGLWDAYKECPRFRKAGRAILHFVQPWGDHLAPTGDFVTASCDHRESLLARLAHANRDPSLLWLLGTLHNDNRILKPEHAPGDLNREVSLRKGFQVPATADTLAVLDLIGKPVHPSKAKVPTAFCDRGRGIVSFRDRWADDGTLVIFDGSHRSPAGQGHAHMSCGHFSLSALGEYFAIDMNRYGTEQSEHNLVLVDGKSGRSTDGQWGTLAYTHGLLTRYRPGAMVDWAAVDSSLQHDCYWARRDLLLVKSPASKGVHPYVVTIDDINKANDFREFWWTLNTSPENSIAIDDHSATITGWRKGNLLDVHLALPAPDEFPKPHTLAFAQDERTTSSHKYIPNPRERAAQYVRPAAMLEGIMFVRPRLVAKVAGYNGRFMSVLLPRLMGEKPPTVERLASLPASLALRITWAKYEDTLIWAFEHNLLEAGEVRGVGHWCVVRRALPSGRMVHHAIGEGTALAVGGRELPV